MRDRARGARVACVAAREYIVTVSRLRRLDGGVAPFPEGLGTLCTHHSFMLRVSDLGVTRRVSVDPQDQRH
jgi:hypothetical protein